MGVTFIALGLLACAWAVLLVPDLRNRSSSSNRSNSVQSFRDHLSGLDRTRPSHTGVRPAGRPTRPASGPAGRPVTVGPRVASTGHRGPVRALPVSTSPFMPRSAAEAARRRSLVLAALVGLAFVTLVGGFAGSRLLLFVHLLVDAALAGFAYLLWERSARSRLRESSLVTLSRVDDDEVALRHEATGS